MGSVMRPGDSATPRTIVELYDEAAGLGVGVQAVEGERSLAEIAGRGRSLASALSELGVEPGERVAAWLSNSTDYMALQAATARLGAILVAVNTRFAAREVVDIVSRSKSRVLLAETGMPLGSDAFAAMPALRHLVRRGDTKDEDKVPNRIARFAFADLVRAAPMGGDRASPDALSTVFTTSGTTAAPKFAAHDQAAVVGHAADVAEALAFRPGAVSLQLLPFCGVFGFVQVMAALAGGAEMVMPGAFDAARAAAIARSGGATHLFATDDMIHRMLETLPEGTTAPAFPALEVAAFALFNSALADLPARAAALGIPMLAPFGMSEVFAIFAVRRHTDAAEVRHRAGGRMVNAAARARVRDPDSGEILPHGAVGELEVKGPHMFRQYFGDASATEAAFTEDGYLRTGDLGSTESDDTFTYLQRAGDTLRLSGFLVSPAEIEAVVMAEPGIDAAQVVAVGTPDGNRPVAFVIAAGGAAIDEAAVIAAVGRVLPKFKTPVRVIRVDAFPLTHGANGTKIQRAKLRAMAQAALEAGKV